MRRLGMMMGVVLVASCVLADEPKEITVVTPKEDGILGADINAGGDVIGFQWVEEPELPGVVSQKPFFAKGDAMTYLPLLEGYTSTLPAALSDDGLVVGRSGKPIRNRRRSPLQIQAFAWDAQAGIRGLGTAEGDVASFATGISRDGRRVTGCTIGDNRIRACVWDRDGDSWTATPLPHEDRLGSNVVAISGDGKLVAAVDGTIPSLWTREESGRWSREAIGEGGTLIPRAVNDGGTVVGLRHIPDGLTDAVVWTRDGGMRVLDKPPGFVKAEANDVNNAGVVVGSLDGPNGSPIGPNAFVYEGGKLRILTQGTLPITSATAINDRGQVAGIIEKEEAPPADDPTVPVDPRSEQATEK